MAESSDESTPKEISLKVSYDTVQQYAADHDLESSRQVAAHFEVSQATAARWLKREDVWVIYRPDGQWQEVYMEQVLKRREG